MALIATPRRTDPAPPRAAEPPRARPDALRCVSALNLAEFIQPCWNIEPPPPPLPLPAWHPGRAICAEDAGEPAAVFDDYEAALRRACEIGKEEETLVFAHGLEGTVHDRYDYRFTQSDDGAMHVQPKGGSWVVETHGEHNDIEAFSTKREAVAHAKPKAKQLGLTLITHYQDGGVQRRIEAH